MEKKIFFLVLLIVWSFGYSQQVDSTRLTDPIEPTFQFIHFNLDPDSQAYSATTTMSLILHKAVNRFRLHGAGFTIIDIELSKDEKQIYLEQAVQTISFSDIQHIDWVYLRNNSVGYFIQQLPADMLQKVILSEDLNVFEKNDV
jgi:hypothetical protein